MRSGPVGCWKQGAWNGTKGHHGKRVQSRAGERRRGKELTSIPKERWWPPIKSRKPQKEGPFLNNGTPGGCRTLVGQRGRESMEASGNAVHNWSAPRPGLCRWWINHFREIAVKEGCGGKKMKQELV